MTLQFNKKPMALKVVFKCAKIRILEIIFTCVTTENALNRFSPLVIALGLSIFLICLMGNTGPFNCTATFLSSSCKWQILRNAAKIVENYTKEIHTVASPFRIFLLACFGNRINLDLYSFNL